MSLSVLDLGRMPYPTVWEMQKELVAARTAGGAPDTLILVEHDHVITLGRKTSPENFKSQEETGVPVFQIERGGTRPITGLASSWDIRS